MTEPDLASNAALHARRPHRPRSRGARHRAWTIAIPPERLFALDQWHYHGTDAVRDAAAFLGLGPTSRVLDIGAGVGGPARFLAHTTGCQVTALELQPELHGSASI